MLRKRQFQGLPLDTVRSIVGQATRAVAKLAKKSPLPPPAPDNASFVPESQDTFSSGRTSRDTTSTSASSCSDAGAASFPAPHDPMVRIKIIDSGSACFAGRAAHAYVQSRFYRSPEVLVRLPYDSAVDMWSLGCVAAELYFGLPILPGVHEHDQLCRIQEMVAPLPDWMVEEG